MLFRQAFLEGLAAETITLAFRRWERPRVKPESSFRSPIGVIAVGAVDVVSPADITEEETRRAGFSSRAELLEELDARGVQGEVYRVELRYAGTDPRAELRQRSDLTDDELAELSRRLELLDTGSRHGSWTAATLRKIADAPGVRATDLAAALGRETVPLKTDVRKLKELGLTESLGSGYRLSPRGRTLLDHLSR